MFTSLTLAANMIRHGWVVALLCALALAFEVRDALRTFQCLLGSTLAAGQKCHMSRSQTTMTPEPPNITSQLGPRVTKSDNNDTRATKHHITILEALARRGEAKG